MKYDVKKSRNNLKTYQLNVNIIATISVHYEKKLEAYLIAFPLSKFISSKHLKDFCTER